MSLDIPAHYTVKQQFILFVNIAILSSLRHQTRQLAKLKHSENLKAHLETGDNPHFLHYNEPNFL